MPVLKRNVKPLSRRSCLHLGGYLLVSLSVWLWPWVVLAVDQRPTTLAAAGGNPLALSAMAFLGWYWMVLLILVGLAAVVRLLGGRVSAPVRASAGIAEDPYLMAYLAGGSQRVLDAVLASLVQQGALRVNPVTRELIAEDVIPDDRPKIERRVRNLLWGVHQIGDAVRFRRWLQTELGLSLNVMRQRLRQAGLLARPALQTWAALPLKIGFAVLLGIGVIRLIAGVAAGRPVGFLVVSLILTALLAWWLTRGLGRERATPRGRQSLEDARSRLGRDAEDRVWMVALLGLEGYGLGVMADLHHVLQVPVGDSLFGTFHLQIKGGNGSGSDGGGGCGDGGCGGCGG